MYPGSRQESQVWDSDRQVGVVIVVMVISVVIVIAAVSIISWLTTDIVIVIVNASLDPGLRQESQV